MFRANIVPGQGFQLFSRWKASAAVSKTGRPMAGEYEKTDTQFYGILTNAVQSEIEEYKQKEHPISHKITEHGASLDVMPTDYLVAEDGRQFYVQGIKNPAGLNVTNLYYVEERFDIIRKEMK